MEVSARPRPSTQVLKRIGEQWGCHAYKADGSGYYVIPAGVVPSYREIKPIHEEFFHAFSDDAFIGEKWHFDRAFKWLGDAAFGAKA